MIMIFGTNDIPEPVTPLAGCSTYMDIVIVLDGSNSIYPWYEVQNFLSNILSKFHISPDQMQVRVLLKKKQQKKNNSFGKKHKFGKSMKRMNGFSHAVEGRELRLGFEAGGGTETGTRVFIQSLKKVQD